MQSNLTDGHLYKIGVCLLLSISRASIRCVFKFTKQFVKS